MQCMEITEIKNNKLIHDTFTRNLRNWFAGD